MQKSLKQRFFFPLLSLALGTTCALFFGELAARQLGLSKTWASYLANRMIMSYIDRAREVGFKRTPGALFIAPRGVKFRVNSLGFREGEIRPKKTRIRIALLGDSVTEGFGVEVHQRFSDHLQARLNERSEGWETINFGVSGHATVDQLQVLRQDVLQLDPDYVVLQFGANDFKRNRQVEFRRRGISQGEELQVGGASGGPKAFLQKHSALYLSIAERYNTYKLRRNQIGPVWERLLQVGAEEWNVTEAALIDFVEDCRQNQANLVFVYVPLEVEVLVSDSSLGNRMADRLRQFCHRHGISTVNVVGRLRQAEKNAPVYLDDCHLSVLGNRIVGDALYDHFRRGMIP